MTTTTNATLNQDLPREVRRQRTTRLFAEAATSTGEDRQQLIEEVIVANTSVARTIAQRYAGRGIPVADLEQVAYVALVRAAHKFDGAKAEDFLVFAVPTIRGEIKRWFRDHGWTVRPPRRLQELQAAVLRAKEELDGEATAADIAARLGVPEQEVAEALAVRGCFAPSSLDAPVEASTGEGLSLADLLPGEDGGLGAAEDRLVLEQALAKLTSRERLIVHLRFVEDRTQAEIGEVIGVTQMQVSRILSKVLKTLRSQLRDSGLAAA
jgi:RNA polymerase sigma-B factor